MIQSLQKIYSLCLKWKHFPRTDIEDSMSRMFYSGITNRWEILCKNSGFWEFCLNIYFIIAPKVAAQLYRHLFNCVFCLQLTTINSSTVRFKIFFSFLMRPKPCLFCTVRKSIWYLHMLSSVIRCSHQWWNTL